MHLTLLKMQKYGQEKTIIPIEMMVFVFIKISLFFSPLWVQNKHELNHGIPLRWPENF